MTLSYIFNKIAAGICWLPKEIGKGFSKLTRLITVTNDAKQLASDVLPKLLNTLDFVRQLVTATIKDGGAFLAAITGLGTAVAAAVEAGITNIAADEAVVVAVKNLIGIINQAHIADILSAWRGLVNAAHELDATAEADLKKLDADVSIDAPPVAAAVAS